MAEHTTDTNALPDAAWFAEHVMKWHKDWHEMPGNIMMHHAWFDADGVFQAWVAAWNPKTHDADALHLWRQMPNSKALVWDDEQCTIVAVVGDMVEATGNPLPLAICRAVHAWWLAQPTVHNTGTGEHP